MFVFWSLRTHHRSCISLSLLECTVFYVECIPCEWELNSNFQTCLDPLVSHINSLHIYEQYF